MAPDRYETVRSKAAYVAVCSNLIITVFISMWEANLRVEYVLPPSSAVIYSILSFFAFPLKILKSDFVRSLGNSTV